MFIAQQLMPNALLSLPVGHPHPPRAVCVRLLLPVGQAAPSRSFGLALVLAAVHCFRAVPGGAVSPERVVGPLPGGPRARARLPYVAGVAAARPAMLPARSATR